jgi:hypothetical protein
MDKVSKILTPKKKDQSADTKPPQKFINFPLTPQKNRRDQRIPTDLTAQIRLWGHPSDLHPYCETKILGAIWMLSIY